MAKIETFEAKDLSQDANELFQRTFGYQPSGIWAAPGRVNLIGEHVDYNAGLCLPIALPHCTFAAFTPRDDDAVRIVSAQAVSKPWVGTLSDIGPGKPKSWAAYAAGMIYALGIEHGFDAAITSSVPSGAGLSSSAALECVIAMAISDADDSLSDECRLQLATAARRAENEVVQAPTGGLDQMASMLTSAGHALLLDCESWEFRQVPFDLQADGLELLVIDTRAQHALVDSEYATRRATCEAAAKTLGIPSLRHAVMADLARLDETTRPFVRHVITEIQRVQQSADLLDAGKIREIGELFTASHASMRDDYRITCPELDVAVEVANDNGAYGARMTGGGFGGSAIAIVSKSDVSRISQAVAEAFARHQFKAPRFLPTWAAERARRIS